MIFKVGDIVRVCSDPHPYKIKSIEGNNIKVTYIEGDSTWPKNPFIGRTNYSPIDLHLTLDNRKYN